MIKRSFFVAAMLISILTAYAQDPSKVEMADALRSSGKIYVVVVTIAVIFVGLAIWLLSIDRRLKKIEKEN